MRYFVFYLVGLSSLSNCFHNYFTGKDVNDTIRGGDGDDVVLGDNGEILREYVSIVTEFPWRVYNWIRYAAPYDSEKIRDVRRYDDIDFIQGDDRIEGGNGNDILHGQRGNDWIYGDDGDGKSKD